MEAMKAALFAVIIIMLFPFGAASQDVPYIDITSPANGSTVSGTTVVEVEAQGYGLENPFLVIQGEQVGMGFPLQDCEYSEPIGGGPEQMYCSYDWDSGSFEGEKVTITAYVDEQSGQIKDSVMVYVSGECA